MPEHAEYHIKIDRTNLVVDHSPVKGSELRNLGSVPDGYDLWLKVPGKADDQLVKGEDDINLKEGMHFYTAKTVLTPGQ